jgi:hypothetical protein
VGVGGAVPAGARSQVTTVVAEPPAYVNVIVARPAWRWAGDRNRRGAVQAQQLFWTSFWRRRVRAAPARRGPPATISPVDSAAVLEPAAEHGETVRRRAGLGGRQLLLGSALLVSAALVTRPAADVDFWWHLQTGRWILEHGRLPGHDLYTFTAAGHPWTDHEYLTEVAIWLLSSHLGFAAASLALSLVTVLGFWFLLRTAELRRPAPLVLALGLVVGALAGAAVWGTRPQMVTFALACLELYWLHRYLMGAGAAIRWFPLVMVLWANLHGGWIVAFGFLALAILTEVIHALASSARGAGAAERPAKRRLHLGRAWRLGVVALLSAVAVACTPNGLALYLYPVRTQLSTAQQLYIQEWQTPDLHQRVFAGFAAMMLLVVLGMALRRPRLFELLLVLATLAMALFSLRHILLFVAAATPVLVWCWSDAWRQLRHRLPEGRLSDRLPRLRWRPPARLLTAATPMALGLVAALVSLDLARIEASQPQVVRGAYPVAAVDRILAGHPRCTRIFNEYAWGGYLIYRLPPSPGRQVFIFGEADVMGDANFDRYMQIWNGQPGWIDELVYSGSDCVLVGSYSPLAGAVLARPSWRLVYADRVAVLYERG